MNLYVLKRKGDPGLDEATGFVVRASHAQAARRAASEAHGDEGPEIWLDTSLTTCRSIRNPGREAIILRSFNAG